MRPASGVAMARFKQELLLASRISHKNILRIHDLGDWNGVKFITMPYIEGRDLAHVIGTAERHEVDPALVNAFAFGGANCSIVLRRRG